MKKVEKISAEMYEVVTSRGKEKFYVLDTTKYLGSTYYLVESCKYGEEVPSIILQKNSFNELKVVEWEWFDTLDQWLEDEIFIEEITFMD